MTRTRAERSEAAPATRTPKAAPTHPVAALHQGAGNRAVASLLSTGLPVQRHMQPTMAAEVGEADETQTPAGGTGTGTTGTATLRGPARRRAIEDILRASNTGTWALDIVRRWSIPVNYEYTGTGSYHQGGRIYINRSLGIGAAAMTMMHEAQHADTFKSGRQADRATLSRADYIRLSIADEAEAVVRQIEGLAVTQRLGVDMTGNAVGDNLKRRYLRVFYRKRDQLRAANPRMTTAEINARCRTFARNTEVTRWFHDGTFVTSTDNNSYAVFYGLQWDEVHAPPRRRP